MNPTLQGILIVVMLVVLFGTPLYALFDRKRKQTILLAWLGCILAGGFAVMLFEKKEEPAAVDSPKKENRSRGDRRIDAWVVAKKIVTIDAGRRGSVKQENVTRVQALLKQFTGNYTITETEVADKVVYGVHSLLRDKYGITQKLQDTMEDINRVRFPKPQKGDFAKLVVVYVQMRNAGQSRTEAVNRLSAALALDNRALDKFLNQ